MKRKVFHQCGHYSNWNIESFVTDSCGDGLILSPVHYSRSQIDKLNADIKKESLFDPQFYLPRSTKKKLNSYNFFPENISDGFDTTDFSSVANECAKLCVQFQLEQDFRAVVIPTRYYDQMLPDLTERQDVFTVLPFLQAIKELKIKKEVVISVVLTNHMLESKVYRKTILNWLTSHQEITGVYLIHDCDRELKQISAPESLSALIDFGYELLDADLDVLFGYLNSESLLLYAMRNVSVTMGSFENTRIFSIDKFINLTEERRGPKARIYLPGLLNSIQIGEAKEIRRRLPSLWEKIYAETPYAEKALEARVEPTFNQPDLYKHYFINISNQLAEVNEKKPSERVSVLLEWIGHAEECYRELKRRGIEVDVHGGPGHLLAWREATKHI
jgi:hypothetical protein